MTWIGLRRFRAIVLVSVATMVAAEMACAHPAAASAAENCAGILSITLSDSVSFTTAAFSDSGTHTCVMVDTNGNPPVFGDVTVGPRTFTNSFTYTGNCAEGSLSFSDGSGGLFIAGVLILTNPQPGEMAAVLTPSGEPCQGVAGSTMTWSGASEYTAASQ